MPTEHTKGRTPDSASTEKANSSSTQDEEQLAEGSSAEKTEPSEEEKDESLKKDAWDKLKIIGQGLLLPAVLAVATIVTNVQLSVINKHLKENEQDVSLIKEFKTIYYDKETRRFSIVFLRRIANPQLRQEMRAFIVWDVLERQRLGGKERFAFDSELSDWHLFGEAVFDSYLEAQTNTNQSQLWLNWWKLNVKDTVLRRWADDRDEMIRAFRWVEFQYLDSPNLPAEGPISRHSLASPLEPQGS